MNSAAIACPETKGDPTRTRDRWLAVVSHTDPRYGGLSAAVPQGELAAAAEGGFEPALAAFCAQGEHFRPAGFAEEQMSFWPIARQPWFRAPELRQSFEQTVQGATGVHIHGLWEASTALAARAADKTGKPYVLSAHGMLEPWALANKRWKKAVYAALVERKVVARAACLHALTRAEAEQYRNFGARNPIAIIPNAVTVPEERSGEPLLQRFPALRGRRLLLFMGRLHPKKGLDLLVQSWERLWAQNPEWRLVLAGPDAEGTEAKLRASFTGDIEQSVVFTGMLDVTHKWSALAAAEGFVLPSYSEGLSMGVLEALGAGLPVVITTHCNLPEAAAAGAGWEIAADREALVTALATLMASRPEENRARGHHGRTLVTSGYDARSVALRMAEIYNFVTHGVAPATTEMSFCTYP